ncbi:polyketide synthase dehydratase domain-containing protein [Streptomyces sp. UP1A-1]|nr:polyketide synthase dehydratase domain-containing protein [Streptomyces sp. UP1A-1]
MRTWPPRGATALELDGFYDALTDHGLRYGPAFQGLRAAWRHGDTLFAEVTLPDHLIDGGAYGLHPALLDAALHAHLAEVVDGESRADGTDGLGHSVLVERGTSPLRRCHGAEGPSHR